MTETNLYLIRHGEAVSNVEPIVGGVRGDSGLTPRGIAQAERLRDRLAATGEIAADVLIASTMPRARQTAEIIAPALGLTIRLDDDVQEMRPGEADGLSVAEFRARFGIPDFTQEPFRPLAPGGESWAQFTLRAGHALDRITAEYTGKTVVVVCHGGIVDGSFVYFFGLSSLQLPPVRFFTRNTSITHWQHPDDDDRMRRWRLMRYNDDAHLHGLGAQAPISWRGVMPPGEGPEKPSVPMPSEQPDDA